MFVHNLFFLVFFFGSLFFLKKNYLSGETLHMVRAPHLLVLIGLSGLKAHKAYLLGSVWVCAER